MRIEYKREASEERETPTTRAYQELAAQALFFVRLSPSGVSRAPRSHDKREKKKIITPILQAIANASCRCQEHLM